MLGPLVELVVYGPYDLVAAHAGYGLYEMPRIALPHVAPLISSVLLFQAGGSVPQGIDEEALAGNRMRGMSTCGIHWWQLGVSTVNLS